MAATAVVFVVFGGPIAWASAETVGQQATVGRSPTRAETAGRDPDQPVALKPESAPPATSPVLVPATGNGDTETTAVPAETGLGPLLPLGLGVMILGASSLLVLLRYPDGDMD